MHTICCSGRLSCQEYTPYPTTIENENLARLRDFGFELVQSTPFPWKWKLGQIEGLWIWVGPEYPPPPLKMKAWSDWGALDLSCPEYTLPNYVGTGEWRLIAVSDKDTVSFK